MYYINHTNLFCKFDPNFAIFSNILKIIVKSRLYHFIHCLSILFLNRIFRDRVEVSFTILEKSILLEQATLWRSKSHSLNLETTQSETIVRISRRNFLPLSLSAVTDCFSVTHCRFPSLLSRVFRQENEAYHVLRFTRGAIV